MTAAVRAASRPASPDRLHRPTAAWLVAVAVAAFVAGCASGPKSGGGRGSGGTGQGGGFYQQDGPGDIGRLQGTAIVDAVPRVEPLMSGPNKPYTVLGRDYTPDTAERPFSQRGVASWYGRQFHGRQTSSGERYDMYAMTAAHPTLPIPSYARVTRRDTGQSVIVRVNDRGPFLQGRVIDLSYAAAYKLGYLNQGSTDVTVERILPAEIRAGTWQRGTAVAVAQAPTPAAPPPPVVVGRPSPPVSAAGDDGRDDPIAAFASAPGPVAAAPSPAPAPTPAPMAISDLPPIMASAPAGVPVRGDAGDPLPALNAPGVYMQLGALRAADGAESLARHLGSELDWLGSSLGLEASDGWYRLRAGPYASRGEAYAAATRVRDALGMSPVIVEQR
ncbi:MAG: Endolytic peptidoglycan transglycosylase RlpA [Paracidovorax wautersii]|uniref:Endolytic peptidoglycan transglycosylase RlpA n=1 Tax=Paracidovorax wautersii TaxID=1177982 RepID=A0A7V8JQ39_9BURK|nr:MAG: Endolytic peptidoglycan transglycosylase RlpA [Paracidovorax wautersii]